MFCDAQILHFITNSNTKSEQKNSLKLVNILKQTEMMKGFILFSVKQSDHTSHPEKVE
jgi:hypothetical protein